MKGSHSQAQAASRRRRCGWLLPLLVGAAFLGEIAFLGRLDMSKNAAAVESWTTSFYHLSSTWGADAPPGSGDNDDECEERLEREDAVPYDRDFERDPVLVGGAAKDWNRCSVGCEFGFPASKTPDATFGIAPDPSVESILRSMESSQYYSENNINAARGRGYQIVMTTSLSSDVPVGYFSWAEYDIMAPVPPKTEEALAAAFISNCGARNFRLQALEMLESLDVKIDSYGSCHRNRDGKGKRWEGTGTWMGRNAAPLSGAVQENILLLEVCDSCDVSTAKTHMWIVYSVLFCLTMFSKFVFILKKRLLQEFSDGSGGDIEHIV